MMIDFERNPEYPNLIKMRIVYQTYNTEIITDEKDRIKFKNFVSPSKKYVEGWIPESEYAKAKFDLVEWINQNYDDCNHYAFDETQVYGYPKVEILTHFTLDNQGDWT